jgi:hypothetical protein
MFNLAEIKVILTTLIIIFGGVSLCCQTRETNQLTTQELEVYKTILGEKPKETVVIDVSGVGIYGEISTDGLKKILSGLQNDTFDNFAKVNANSLSITNIVQTSFDYPLINKVDIEKNNLRLSGYYVFSRVGFSNDEKQAVVMFADVRSPLGAKGIYFLLTKKRGFWEIQQESEIWRS